MKKPISGGHRPLTEAQKKLFAFLSLMLISALTATLAVFRADELRTAPHVLMIAFLSLLAYFATVYAMPLPTDGYHVLLPIITAVGLTALLISTAFVDMRMIQEAQANGLFTSFSVMVGAVLLEFFSFLYMIFGLILTRDTKKEGLPPIFHDMGRKAYKILYGSLAGVLLITGVTTSISHYVQMTELNTYMVSENDYTTVMPNLRVVAATDSPESVSHGFDSIEYAAIDGVNHHEFLCAKQTEWVLLGTEIHQPILLRAQDSTTDPARDAPIKSMTLTGKTDVAVTPALEAQITNIIRGGGTPYRHQGEKEPNEYNTSPARAQDLMVTVTFEGYDALPGAPPW